MVRMGGWRGRLDTIAVTGLVCTTAGTRRRLANTCTAAGVEEDENTCSIMGKVEIGLMISEK